MNKCPNVGDRVRYLGGPVVGPCVGTVIAIYPTYEWDEDRDREGPAKPEREWRVAMKPDKLPPKWSYTNNDKFAPEVALLEVANP